MAKLKQRSQILVQLVIAIAVVGIGISLGVVGCNPNPQVPSETTVEQPLPQEQVTIYWLKVTQKQTQLLRSSVTLAKANNQEERLEVALKALLAGPNNSSETTAIPCGTKLLDVTTEKNKVEIDLSNEFTTGGGSASMIARLAQVIYTATTLEPKAQVWINVEGKPLEILGEGDGIIVDQPMTRQRFEENFTL